MKIRVNKWLSCGLALMVTLGLGMSINHANASKTTQQNYQNLTIQPVNKKHSSSNNKQIIDHVTSIPNQGYTNYVTGQNALFSLPGTVKGARVVYGRRSMQNFARRRVRFMTYQRAVTNRGLVYYKIVSLRHSVRGWMYQSAIRSMLNRQQQAADLTFNSQITHAEMVADQSKHKSLVSQTKINLNDAKGIMNEANKSVKILKGTPDYSVARAALRSGQKYLRQIATVQPSPKTMLGLATIRSEYRKAEKDVTAAQKVSLNGQTAKANKDIKKANQSLMHVSKILNQIRNRRDRKVAMALFNQALKYVNTNYSFDPAKELNGRNLNSRRISNLQVVNLISTYETNAKNAIMDLYPNLDNFDVALMDAYRAQSDLNEANDLVTSLNGAHIRKAELDNIKLNQHNINDLWNV